MTGRNGAAQNKLTSGTSLGKDGSRLACFQVSVCRIHSKFRMESALLKWLSPGDIICDLLGLPNENEHRMVLRMFANILIYGGLAVGLAFIVAT